MLSQRTRSSANLDTGALSTSRMHVIYGSLESELVEFERVDYAVESLKVDLNLCKEFLKISDKFVTGIKKERNK